MSLFRRFLLALCFPVFAISSFAVTEIFHDDFESGPLGPAWSLSGTGDGRVRMTSLYEPASGQNHLVFDDAVNDATYSAAEAILSLNLANKKNVILSFKAKSLGNEAQIPPLGETTLRNYDGVAISTNGGATWRSVQSLSAVGAAWQTFQIVLDTAVNASGGEYGSHFLIRFSEYDNAAAPIDGIAIDDVVVTADEDLRVALELPLSVPEGTGPHIGYVLLNAPHAEPLTVALSSTPAGQLVAPSSVEVPAGEVFVSFEFSVADDDLVNLTHTATVTPATPDAVVSSTSIQILDNDPPPVATLILPASVTEGISVTSNAILSLDVAPATFAIFSLSSSPSGEVNLPNTVTVPAGQRQVAFTISAVNDSRLDGSIAVTVTAINPLLAPATAQVVAVDNEMPALAISLPATAVEGTTATGTVTLSAPLSTPLDVNLGSTDPGSAMVPAKVSIPAGQTATTFQLTLIDDTLVNLTRSVKIGANGTGVSSTSSTVIVTDDEQAPSVALSLPPALAEGESPSNNATVSLSSPVAVPITISFMANPSGELTLPASVTILPGQTEMAFSARATNDSKIDGDVDVTVATNAAGLNAATAQTTTIDNETHNLGMSFSSTLQEGVTGNGTVSISGTLPTPVLVALKTDSPTAIVSPAFVTISAGLASASFTMTALDNAALDGSRTVTIAAEVAGFTSVTRSVAVKDNDLASYAISALPDIVNVSAPVSLTISAADTEQNVITGFTGSIYLAVVLPDGSTQPANPSTIAISSGGKWSGTVTLPAVTASSLRFRVSDIQGVTSESSSFELMRTLNLQTADLLWDAARGRLYASVPSTATSPYANSVVAIDPETMAVVASVFTGQNPGQLVLTSGGEYLYVALNANGVVMKLDPTTMTSLSNFSLGADPDYGPFYVGDFCAITDQPEALIVSRIRKNVNPQHGGVAVYDNGVMRPAVTQSHTGSNLIEPSIDPTLFFGYNNSSSEYGFRRLKVSASGVVEQDVYIGPLTGYNLDFKSVGDLVFASNGMVVNGAVAQRIGTFPTSGVMCPNLAANRVYFLEVQDGFSSRYDKISAQDPATFSLIRRLSISPVTSAASLTRWGTNGLAFRTSTDVAFIHSNQLIPTEPPADLATTLQVSANPTAVNAPLTYTMTTTNQGPNAARGVVVVTTLAEGQAVQIATGDKGPAEVRGNITTYRVGELAAGETTTMTMTVIPQNPGSLTCAVTTLADSADPDFSNNTAFRFITVGFQATSGAVNQLQLPANNVIYDRTRNVLWASVPVSAQAPLGGSIVSIDPNTGVVSNPIPIHGNPMPNAIALSGNGRYLYLGLWDAFEVHRVDLASNPPTSMRIPLSSVGGGTNHAEDITVLDGEGTSFIVVGADDHSAAVYDGTTRRPNRTPSGSIGQIEPTPVPGVFVGFNDYSSSFETSLLSVTAGGVSVIQSANYILNGYNMDIRTSGNLLLSSTGRIVNIDNLSLRANLEATGRPAIDAAYGRAYLVYGNSLKSFSTENGGLVATLPLPTTATDDWARMCVRWGVDGFAIVGNDGKTYLTRWAEAIPADMDQNGDHIDDAWAAKYFGSLQVHAAGDADGDGICDALEYLFATSPIQATPRPMEGRVATENGRAVLHLVFPRRVGVTRGDYRYEKSTDLVAWQEAIYAVENVIATQTIDGVVVETVDAAIEFDQNSSGFVRIKWISR